MGKKLDIFGVFVDYNFQLSEAVLQLNLNNGTSAVLDLREPIPYPYLPRL
jgi:hypothetical protein